MARLQRVNPGPSEHVHLSRLSVMDDFPEVFSWPKVHIWTFKSRYANRCLLSNTIIEADLTWVGKILFPSSFISHVEITFLRRRQPHRLWWEWHVSRWKCRVPSVWGSTCIPNEHRHLVLRPQNANETGPYFPVLVCRPLPRDVWHAVNLPFFVLILCACLWHLSCSQILGNGFSVGQFLFWAQMEQNEWYSFRWFLSDPSIVLAYSSSSQPLSHWPDSTRWVTQIAYMSLSYAVFLVIKANLDYIVRPVSKKKENNLVLLFILIKILRA